jgi:hypothetical protein
VIKVGQKKQHQIGMKQREKRKKQRAQLVKKGAKLEDYYYGKFYLKAA